MSTSKKIETASRDQITTNIFSSVRTLQSPKVNLPPDLPLNAKWQMDGRVLLRKLSDDAACAVFLIHSFEGYTTK